MAAAAPPRKRITYSRTELLLLRSAVVKREKAQASVEEAFQLAINNRDPPETLDLETWYKLNAPEGLPPFRPPPGFEKAMIAADTVPRECVQVVQ